MNRYSDKRYFIRFGELPEDGISHSWNIEGEQTGTEDGLSVYDATNVNGKWQIVLPNPVSARGLNTLCALLIYQKRKVFILTGDVVGHGSDNEPLIKNATIVEDISDSFKIVP